MPIGINIAKSPSTAARRKVGTCGWDGQQGTAQAKRSPLAWLQNYPAHGLRNEIKVRSQKAQE
jgi:hypothetical protein